MSLLQEGNEEGLHLGVVMDLVLSHSFSLATHKSLVWKLTSYNEHFVQNHHSIFKS